MRHNSYEMRGKSGGDGGSYGCILGRSGNLEDGAAAGPAGGEQFPSECGAFIGVRSRLKPVDEIDYRGRRIRVNPPLELIMDDSRPAGDLGIAALRGLSHGFLGCFPCLPQSL